MEVILTGENSMDVQVGDASSQKNRILRQQHFRCAAAWEWISVSAVPNADREVMVPRSKIEKNIKKVVREALPL